MKISVLLLIAFITVNVSAQNSLTGVWQGLLMKEGSKQTESIIFYLEIQQNGNSITCKTREEFYNSTFFILQNTKTKIEKDQININQTFAEKKKINSKISVCTYDITLKYTDTTGFLTGTYNSPSCRGNGGKLILYHTNLKTVVSETPLMDHSWRERFIIDLSKGRKAPEVQEFERKNFQFQPIYFDHDKAEIKPEFYAYLSKMARVVNGHSDLRIKIIGHTDADGSDIYNVDLSARRAKAIQDYFLKCGLESFKLVIEFKGEKMPIDNNQTPEGKQHNRRVDFQFI